LAIVAILPYIISEVTGIPSGLALGGTGLIIIVTATMEL
jgi:preprotein translocase subunit SecY